METYFNELLASELPFEPWVAALIWIAFLIASRWVAQSLRAANDAQHAVTVEDWGALRRSLEPRYLVVQVLVVGIVFLLASMLGKAAFVFLAGGVIVASAFGLGLSAQGLLTARALALPHAITRLKKPTADLLNRFEFMCAPCQSTFGRCSSAVQQTWAGRLRLPKRLCFSLFP